MRNKTVCMVGLGYIGLPTAAVIAAHGVRVFGVDTNADVVRTINRGEVHIAEPELESAVRQVVENGALRAFTEAQPADVFLIAVPTPFREGFEPDLSYIESASRAVARVLKRGDLVILESTSPVGATEKMCEWLAEERPDLSFPTDAGEQSDIRIAHCPERVLPGRVIQELVRNDRIIGGMTEACTEAACRLYGLFVLGELIRTDTRTAEMCKLTENAYRDLNVAFANELSLVCDRLGINVWELIRMANHHPRVNILQPGAGVGGHCIAVDPWFLISDAPDVTPLMRAARAVNDGKPAYVVSEIRRRLGSAAPAVVACLGLAFKPDICDLRGSPAVKIVEDLAEDPGLTVLVVEPHIEQLPAAWAKHRNIELVALDEALARAGVVAALVKHRALVAGCRDRDLGHERLLDFVNLLGPVKVASDAVNGSAPRENREAVVPVLAAVPSGQS